MSDEASAQEAAERIASLGREALVERLRGAYADAAAAHSDIVSVDHDRIESMVQSAADRADGLQWRRALATVAAEQLGISVTEALNHPAVASAQQLLGAPSYEESLSELIAQPVPLPPAPPEHSPAAELSASSDAAATQTSPVRESAVPEVIPGQEELFPIGGELEEVRADEEELGLMPEPLPEAYDDEDAPAASGGRTPPSPRPGFEPPAGYVPSEIDYSDEEILSSSLESIEADDAIFDLLPAADPGEFEDSAPDQMPQLSEALPPPLLESVPYVPDEDDDAPELLTADTSPEHELAPEPQLDSPASGAGGLQSDEQLEGQLAFAPDVVAGANQPTQVFEAFAEPEQEPQAVAEPKSESAPDNDPHATQIHDMAAEFAAQDSDEDETAPIEAPAPDSASASATPSDPIPSWQPPTGLRRHDAEDAIDFFDEEPFDEFNPEPAADLQVTAVHLGGVANLPTRGDGLDLRLSEAGLDIMQPNDEIVGRLQWPEIHALEVSALRGRLLGKSKQGARLTVRTRHGDATFEVPQMSADELRVHVDALAASYKPGH